MEAQLWWQWQHVRKRGGSVAALAETQRQQRKHGISGGSGSSDGSGGSVACSTAAMGEGRDVLATSYSQVMVAARGRGGEGCASHIIFPGSP